MSCWIRNPAHLWAVSSRAGCEGRAEVSRVKDLHKRLIRDHVRMDSTGGFSNDGVKEWEGSCEPRDIKQKRSGV